MTGLHGELQAGRKPVTWFILRLKWIFREVVSQREELGKKSHRMDVDQQKLMDSVDKDKLSKDPQMALDVKKAMVKFQV